MNYVEIIKLIFSIISALISLYILHFFFFSVLGAIHKKRFPKADEKCHYAVLISAKDEEKVIPRLINSIRDADYPQDKLDIIIIAHNCQDNTADMARSMGARVIVYNDLSPSSQTLGAAYHYAFKQIDVKNYDGFIVLNADNVVKKDYFDKINDAFLYYGKHDPIATFRHALNIKDGALPAVYSYYFAAQCTLVYAGRANFGVSCRVSGCGFLIPSRLLENGWNYTSITEDIEFSGEMILKGENIRYCDEAIFYDEQPRKIKIMWFQRLRWAKGQIIMSRRFVPKFFKALFAKDKKNKMSLYATLTFHSFIVLTIFFLFLAQNILLLLSPLFSIPLEETFLYWNNDASWFYNLFISSHIGALFELLRSLIYFHLSCYFIAILILIGSRGKYKNQPKIPLILGFIIFPLFYLLQTPLDVCALFSPNIKWRKIPHGE